MSMRDRITKKLTEAFHPEALEVIDESHLHHGHAGWREGGETHFRVKLVSECFVGLNRLERHRRVNAALAEELSETVHALAIQTKTPDE